MKTRCLLILVLAISLGTHARENWRKLSENPEYLHRSIKQVTDVIVHDIYSPPVASRIYAYVTVAAYEAARPMDERYRSLAGQLHGLDNLPQPIPSTEYSFSVAAVHALLTVARSMIISEDRIARFHGEILQELKASGMPAQVYDNSLAFGKQVAERIIAWSLLDNYKQTRSLPKYSVSAAASTWKPTPPSYMKAVEPHWDGMRTFLIDSAKQFRPPAATNFSIDSSSQFFQEAMQVYEAGLKLTAAQVEIANFWDCNPFKMNINGHVMYATKKISPGGHWINITGLACRKANADFARSAEAYACVSVLLADAFISCWDEKYRSNVIRPETYINQYIDQSWTPLLQTPPFPEYTSGHSVISSAGALMLTKLFGEDFSYADSTEVEFDIPVRQFSSFRQAAKEAAISRFYGGIHYMPSIINGVEEGEKIGQYYLSKLRTRAQPFTKDTIVLADPCILADKGKYYLYGTMGGNPNNGFAAYWSDDLENWKPSNAEGSYALQKGRVFGTANFWAPQVFRSGDSLVMAYVADEHIALASSKAPTGPFIQREAAPLAAPVKQIDPYVFIDDDGRKYLYHVRLEKGNRIFVAELENDLSSIKTATLKECIAATEPWENTAGASWPVAEGPSIIKHNNIYYLFYTANDFRNPDYAMGYATSKSPLGPWTKYAGNPVLSKKDLGINGTGHGDFVMDNRNQLWYVFHTHHSNSVVSPRKTAMIKVRFVEDKPGIDKLVIDPKTFRYLVAGDQ